MKKFFTPLLVLCMMTGLVFLTGCPKDPCETVDCGEHGTCNDEGKCDCEEGWSGEFCDVEDVEPGKTGNVEVVVKKLKNGKIQNNYSCMAVLGNTKEEMYFHELTAGKVNGGDITKIMMKGYDSLKSNELLIDTFYSRKGSGVDPGSGAKAGVIKIEGVAEGNYYLHVFDGSGDKYVTPVTITEATGDDVVVAEVEPLGKIKVIVGSSSVIGSEIDSNLIMMFPPSNQDTLQYVLKKKIEDIPFEPLYQGRTSTQINELGKEQNGSYYFIDIPKRRVVIVAYNSQFAQKDGEQAYEFVEMRKNILEKVRVSFK